jgi:hypothetical protein
MLRRRLLALGKLPVRLARGTRDRPGDCSAKRSTFDLSAPRTFSGLIPIFMLSCSGHYDAADLAATSPKTARKC